MKNQIIVNNLQLNRINIITFLAYVFRKFHYKIFSIKEIDADYSEKTIRTMIFLFEKLEFLEISKEHKKHAINYQFKKDFPIEEMILRLSKFE